MSGLFTVLMRLTLGKWETPYLLWGGILLLLTIFTVLSAAHLSKPEPLDKSKKSDCHCHLQNGIVIYRQLFLYPLSFNLQYV